MSAVQRIPAPATPPPVDTLKLAALSVLIFGPQPIYFRTHADRLREYQREGLVEISHGLPRPVEASREPIFFARLTRAGQVLLSRPAGGVQ